MDGVQYMSLSITKSKQDWKEFDFDKVHPIAIFLLWMIPSTDISVSLGAEISYTVVEDCCPKTFMDRITIFWFRGHGVGTLLLKCVQYYLKAKNEDNGISLYATVVVGYLHGVFEGFYTKVGFSGSTEEDKLHVWETFKEHYNKHKYTRDGNVMLTVLPDLITDCVESYHDLRCDLKHVSPSSSRERYDVYPRIDKFCFQNNTFMQKLLQNTGVMKNATLLPLGPMLYNMAIEDCVTRVLTQTWKCMCPSICCLRLKKITSRIFGKKCYWMTNQKK
eukprot:163618-Ditylum_brightwellii.AAC.1